MNEPSVIVLDIKKVLEQLGLESKINISEFFTEDPAKASNHLEFPHKDNQHKNSPAAFPLTT